ncbi:DUF4229 domain-containing protein [Cellulomonas sp. KRMCY2]|uniref:DUF4229 domain-containing protein n=1 Tax=Cellulomonas sp. KRMCY2 TaxID=1304865 RepID=UPI00045E7809|nr:DUF4229 domain-containing protein [Cellulomonas sp. KRMCY2]
MRLIVYSVLRLGLFGMALLGLWAVGMGGWLLVVVAAFVAWALSYLVLAGPRDAAALWLAERAEGRRTSGARFTAGVESDALAEDAEAEVAAQDAETETEAGPGTDTDASPETDTDASPDAGADADAETDADPTVSGPTQSAKPSPSSTP